MKKSQSTIILERFECFEHCWNYSNLIKPMIEEYLSLSLRSIKENWNILNADKISWHLIWNEVTKGKITWIYESFYENILNLEHSPHVEFSAFSYNF
jgi:hypothetical protein